MAQLKTKFIANLAITAAKLASGAATSSQAAFADGSGNVAYRSIMVSDVPTLNQNTTGTAANITATSNATLTTLSALTSASSLAISGSQVSGGIFGAVNGSALTNLSAAALSGVLPVSVTGGSGLSIASTQLTGQVAIANGGTGQATAQAAFDALSPLSATGDTLYFNGTHNSALAIGSTGQVLTVVAGLPAWAPVGVASLTTNHIFVGNASNVATDVAMSGEASIVASGAVTLSNAAVIAKVLTGYTSGAGTISSSDSILSAIEKLNGNDALYLPLAGGTLTGTLNGTNAIFSSTIAASNFSGSSSGTNTGDQTITLTGDVTGSGTGSFATTLAATTNATLTTLSGLTTATALASVGTITSGTWNGTAIAIANGGTGQATAAAAYNALSPMTTAGDLEYEISANTAARLGIGSTGQVLTVVAGLPAWATASSGANVELSNLSAVAINTSLLPGVDNSITLGSGTYSWASANIHHLLSASGALSIDVYGYTLSDGVHGTSVDYANRLLVDTGGATQLSWSTSGIGLPRLTASRVLVLNSSNDIISSPTSTTQLGYLSNATGTTGTTSSNLVFSASPTFTGTLSAAAASFSAAVNMNSNQINNLANGTVSSDAVNLGQLQAAISGLYWQGPANAYADSNVPLTGGATLTIDSYAVQNGNLVILGNQTTASQNGEYTVSGIGSTYVLTPNGLPTAAGDAWLILNGTVYADSAFVANAAVPSATFTEFAGPTAYTFTAPLSLSGRTVSITQSTTSTDGYLSSTDWNTFNNKQAAGNYITALTGDISASGPGSAAASLIATSNATLTTLSALTTASALASVGTITSGTWAGTAIAITHGGTGQTSAAAAYNALSPMTTTGDLEYEISTGVAARLPIGSSGQVLTVVSGAPAWSPAASTSTNGKDTFVLSSTDITNQFVTLSHTPLANSTDLLVQGGGDQLEGASYDYTVSGATIVFENGLATGGVSALVAGDILQVQYEY